MDAKYEVGQRVFYICSATAKDRVKIGTVKEVVDCNTYNHYVLKEVRTHGFLESQLFGDRESADTACRRLQDSYKSTEWKIKNGYYKNGIPSYLKQ